MKIYIDINDGFKCYVSDESGTMLEFDEPSFDGKCKAFIEGHRCKPVGYTWTREDGEVFSGGKMISPWKDSDELAKAQMAYEIEQLKAENADFQAALAKLGVTDDE